MNSFLKRLDSLKTAVRREVLPRAKKQLTKAGFDLAAELLADGRKRAL